MYKMRPQDRELFKVLDQASRKAEGLIRDGILVEAVETARPSETVRLAADQGKLKWVAKARWMCIRERCYGIGLFLLLPALRGRGFPVLSADTVIQKVDDKRLHPESRLFPDSRMDWEHVPPGFDTEGRGTSPNPAYTQLRKALGSKRWLAFPNQKHSKYDPCILEFSLHLPDSTRSVEDTFEPPRF